jgi:light-regulated signal transduction histidine kinase (bacteriophytochrome)
MSRAGVHPVRVDTTELAREVREALADEMLGRDVRWKVGELPEVRADPDLLRLVLENLLSNAVKYTRGRSSAEIEIGGRIEPDGSRVYFVRDNGAGFDMRYVGKLFGIFQRLHRSEEFEGTGIGLATVRRIVTRHGGKVWAEGQVGTGATFYFSLPPEARVEPRVTDGDTGLGPTAEAQP